MIFCLAVRLGGHMKSGVAAREEPEEIVWVAECIGGASPSLPSEPAIEERLHLGRMRWYRVGRAIYLSRE